MNIVFFGGSSYVSRSLIDKLAKKYKIINCSRTKKKNCKNIFIDFENKKTFKNLRKIKFKQIDLIFFFSSYVPMKEKNSTWNKCSINNIYSVINILNEINISIKKIIHSSTTSIYGSQNLQQLKESDFLTPDTNYALTKYAQENIIRIFCNFHQIKFLSFRIGYAYDEYINKNRLVYKLIYQLINSKKVKIKNEKKLNLNLIHTKDISKIISTTMYKNEGIYNLCSVKFFSINDLINSIINTFNLKNCKIITEKNSLHKKTNSYSMKKLSKIYDLKKISNVNENLTKFKI
jgi:nucleoside-diphosphate-sugar epimerase